MPTYEYGCKACGHQFERRQSIKDDPIKDCPECGQPEASRMISQGNFILKGGGWYSDLYSGPSNQKSDGESKPDAKAEGGDGAKSNGKDAKPEGKRKGDGKGGGSGESKPSESKPSSTGSGGGESTSAG